MLKKHQPPTITENISKDTLLELYDENYGFSITVNALERDVDLPDNLKNETKLILNVTRGTAKKIYFEDDELVCDLAFNNKTHECVIPYNRIRNVIPIEYNKKSNFWVEKLAKKNFYLGIFTIIGVIWFFLAIAALVLLYQKDIPIYGHVYFYHTQSFWNDESSIFVFKLFSIIIAMLEGYFLIVIAMMAPVVYAANYFNLTPLSHEILFVVYNAIMFLMFYLVSLFDDKPKEPSLMELNLELLGLRPIFKKKKFNVKNNFVFYVGPFSEEYTEIYNDSIQKPILNSGLKIQRADEIFGTLPVMDDIWNVMNECSLLIAELSGRNPNVMYEIGMAHTIGKKVIIITQNNSDIPFDLRHHRCLLYENTEDGRHELSNKLLSTIKYELGIY